MAQDENFDLTSDIQPLKVDYDFQAPSLGNYESVKAQMTAISDRYKNLIIADENEANEIGKRGGLITQMRKVSKQINEIKVDVHRKAKESYSDFDDKMNDLSALLDDNINNLTAQVETYKREQEEKRYEEIKSMFTEEKNSYQFEQINDKIANFDNFYDKSLLKKSMTDNKVKESIVNYLVKKAKDNERMAKFLKENPEVVKMSALSSFFTKTYFETEDINDTIVQTLDKKKEIDKMMADRLQAQKEQLEREQAQALAEEKRKRELAEQQAQAQTDQAQTEPSSSEPSSSESESVSVVFTINDLSKANLVKQFMVENGIDFDTQVIRK